MMKASHAWKVRGGSRVGFLLGLTIAGIVAAGVWESTLNPPDQTRARAEAAARGWIATHEREPVRTLTCRHDADGDGFSACTVMMATGERHYLLCPASYHQVQRKNATCTQDAVMPPAEAGQDAGR